MKNITKLINVLEGIESNEGVLDRIKGVASALRTGIKGAVDQAKLGYQDASIRMVNRDKTQILYNARANKILILQLNQVIEKAWESDNFKPEDFYYMLIMLAKTRRVVEFFATSTINCIKLSTKENYANYILSSRLATKLKKCNFQ